MLETPFPFFINKKTRVKFRYLELLLAKKKSVLAYISLKIDIFRLAMFYYVIVRWPIFMILVSMERGDPTLYYGTK